MNAYVKGGILAAILIAGIYGWYRANMATLPVNRPPDDYQLISKMEKEGVPDFTLERLDGSKLTLSELKGKTVIVNFWASWCNPCVEEFPSMIKLVDHFKGDVVVVAVSTDEDRKDIETFLKAFGLPKPGFEVVWDKDKSIMAKYGINKIPESFLVGADMKLIRKVMGTENWYTQGAIDYFSDLVRGGAAAAAAKANPHAGSPATPAPAAAPESTPAAQ